MIKYASASNLEQLTNLINKFYYSNNYYITPDLQIKNNKQEYKGNLKIKYVKNKYILYKD